MAQIIDGKALAARIKEKMSTQMPNLEAKYGRRPSLYIILVGDDEGSQRYVKHKLAAAASVGMDSRLITLEPTITEKELLDLIHVLNEDPLVDGILVQLPIPKHLNEYHIIQAIDKGKDVDGFHPLSKLDPCTPRGIMNYLNSEKIQIQGKNAVVIGRSNIVGKPMARLLLAANANVTVLHSKTSFEDMSRYIANADIIVIAIGKAGFLDEKFSYKPDAIIVDVGINRLEDGLHGDAIPNLLVGLQTPVPGGVGLLTRLALYENLLTIVNGK